MSTITEGCESLILGFLGISKTVKIVGDDHFNLDYIATFGSPSEESSQIEAPLNDLSELILPQELNLLKLPKLHR